MANTQGIGFNWKPYLVGGAARPDAISRLNPQFAANLARMIQEAPPEVQAQIRLTSAYRSPDRQAEILTQSLAKRHGPEAAARWQGIVAKNNGDVVAAGREARPWLREIGITRWVAPPGGSNHQKGQAVDFKYLDPSATRWAHENAPKYGLHFPLSNEDWHVEPAGSRGGNSAPSMMAQVQKKTVDPVAEVLAAGGNPVSPPQAAPVQTAGFNPVQQPPVAPDVPPIVPDTPKAPATETAGLLGFDVPKGLPDMLKFASLAAGAGQQQPQDNTPQGGLLPSQPVQLKVAQMGAKQAYKPWEQMLTMFSRRNA